MSKTLTIDHSPIASRWHEVIIRSILGIKQFFHINNRLRFTVWVLSGMDTRVQMSYSAIYCGHPTNKNYIGELIFGESYETKFVGNLWLWQLIALLIKNRDKYLFVLLETKDLLRKLILSKKLFFIPDWVGAIVDLPKDLASITKCSSSIKSKVRMIRNNEFEYIISKKSNDFDRFYNKMYKPYIKGRHQQKAFIKNYDELKKTFQGGELLFIHKNQKIVAGAIINYDQPKGIPRMTQLGVLFGNYDYVKQGAISAIYYYAMEYLWGKGFKSLNLGWSRPFLNDGVLNYKSNWRCRFVTESNRIFILLPLVLNHFAKSFLLNNPFISIYKNKMIGNLFVDGPRQLENLDVEKLKGRYHLSGLSDVKIHALTD